MKRLVHSVLERAARPYAAGPTLEDAMHAASTAARRGYSVTLCYWHRPLEPPEEVSEQYFRTVHALSHAGLDAHMAIKVPGLWEQQSLVDAVVAEARRHGIPVDIDSHEPGKAEDAFRAAENAECSMLGIAVPARWLVSCDLADRAVAIGLRVRVVKGSWPDPRAPRLDPREGFMKVIDRLAGRCREVGVATHNPDLARAAFRKLADSGTGTVQELVYGLPMEAPVAEARRAGVSTRVYIPFGQAWVPYAAGRALREPKIVGFVLRDLLNGKRDSLPAALGREEG